MFSAGPCIATDITASSFGVICFMVACYCQSYFSGGKNKLQLGHLHLTDGKEVLEITTVITTCEPLRKTHHNLKPEP